ncbi:hypothetical protein DVK85_04510 [Flavobacterium arcticum]|uniref:Uncharacterized protein n=1 Tax=Flavobacterium arcticum TaxID=1784713 RepID=A0A345HAC2_9FLAO|nr:hypothetical protein [Flavobacterium arcticum]AXG73532.1 hypothetical protein DVK85_04510 [Flavobacterium arcticum]KAF2513322.1 hypothetical protein E0W72_02565 [Flavobacterium arcticum]
MSFLNIYDKPQDYHYQFSLKAGNVLYYFGKIENDLFILKTDLSGEVLWEKRFSDIYPNVRLSEPTMCDNGDIMILLTEIPAPILLVVATDNTDFVVLRITPTGTIAWKKKYHTPNTGNIYIKRVSTNNYLIKCSSSGLPFGLSSFPFVSLFIKINDLGIVVATKRLDTDNSSNTISINSIKRDLITFDDDYIYLASGNLSYIKLDHNLNLINQFAFANDTNGYHTAYEIKKLSNGKIRIIGKEKFGDNNDYDYFLMELNFLNTTMNQNIMVKRYVDDIGNEYYSGFGLSTEDSLFINRANNNQAVLQKINIADNSTIWTKEITSAPLNLQVSEQEIVCNTVHYPSPTSNVVGLINENMESCISQPYPSPIASLPDVSLSITSDYTVTTNNITVAVTNDVTVSISDITSVKINQCASGDSIDISDNPLFQSPYLYFQAVGSTGTDSTKGIHLRWTLGGTLGDNHIPKGNYAANNVNFNKPNDFVKIYRTPYQKATFTLDLALLPQAVNDQQKFWLYKFNNDTRIFFVYFRNATKYDQVRATINPMTNPSGFIQAYGNEIIEIENKRELFFASKLVVSNTTPTSSLQAEALSVPENQIFVNKSLFFRKTYSSTQLDNVDLISENGRSVRFKPENCTVLQVEFEFYSDFIVNTNSNAAWESLGEYALTLDDELAISQLDPDENNPVKGNWLRFNDEAYVDTDNYVEKWNAPVEEWNRNIKDVVGQYINLSNDPDNPKAVEFFDLNLANDQGGPLTIGSSEDEAGMEISNLDMLLIAGYDYHIARMLGLGTLDLASEVMEGEYIYISEYYTSGSLSNDLSGEVHHLSMSLPTSVNTQRLPLPVALSALVPGFSNEEGEDGSANVDENGYSFDGRKRYIKIFPEQLPQGEINPVFFANEIDFDGSTFTMPIYAGLEYRKVEPGQSDTGIWEKPELSHTKKYLNIDGTSIESYETLPIIIPDYNNPLYTHRQTRSGMYYYSGYGINWFSRATTSDIVLQIETEIKPYNSLLPPTNINALLIVNESPLMFSSQSEQLKLAQINDADKTLIRLTFDYDANNEVINYQIPIDTAVPDSDFVTDPEVLFPDDDEIFAEDVEIFFRNETPKTIYTKVVSVSQDSSPFLSVLQTESYHQIDGMVPSEFPEGTTSQNFIGSLLVMGDQQYIVNNIVETPNGLRFTVYNQQITNSIMGNEVATVGSQPIMTPTIENDGLCTIVENMQNTSSWGAQTNPHSLKVKIGFDGTNSWGVNRELVRFVNDAGLVEKYIEKTRGFWEEATIEKFLENFTFQNSNGELIQKTNTHRGIYKITFNSFSLPQHVQYNNNDVSVEFFNGTVRLYTENNMVSGSLTDSREVFKVFKTENIGTANNLVLYIHDENFQSDGQGNPSVDNNNILIDNNISVNYYPSYKVYLYHDPLHNLTEEKILPEEGEGVHYSIFGLRAVDYDNTNNDNTFYKSRLSVPAIMFAQEIILPQVPNGPQGVLYATRPDFFGKSTYTFTTQFSHKPYSVGFYRSDDQALLSSIYEIETIREIRADLANIGGNQEEYLTDRWQNFLDFDLLSTDGDYSTFPPNLENAYKFPLPNKVKFFDEINFFIQKHNQHYDTSIPLISNDYYGNMALDSIVITMPNSNNLSLLDFVKEAILNVFVPLNEIPVIYNFIHTESGYKPTNKKPVIRDDNGYLLNPRDANSGFEMAPMMKVVGTNKIQFTDFTLDGTTSNLYFYAAKEIGSQMKMSDFSTPLGPIKMVNTNAPEAPKIKSALPVLSNDMLNITSKISFEINAYPLVQNIKKIKLYRTDSRIDAESIYFMTLVKEVDLEADGMDTNNIWKFTDDFSDLEEIPFGDTLFYRVTVSREVEYADDEDNIVIEYAPSQPSKILATIVSESKKPNSPVLSHSFEPIQSYLLKDIVLHWDKMCYKGTYHVYKMNNQGHWVKIHEINTNDENIHLPLEDTNLESSDLTVIDAQANPIYHHFKVITENTAGMFSTEENVLTIWKDVGGIGEMKISHSFVIR